MNLPDLVADLETCGVYPVSFTWQHVRAGVYLTDPIRIRWTLYVATCAEFEALAVHWKGKRCDRPPFHGSRTLQADIGERGLLGHVCHDGLPCWTTHHRSTEGDPETMTTAIFALADGDADTPAEAIALAYGLDQ